MYLIIQVTLQFSDAVVFFFFFFYEGNKKLFLFGILLLSLKKPLPINKW